jgi:hypothetical protein
MSLIQVTAVLTALATAEPIAQGTSDVAAFTTVYFENAPEALFRVASWKAGPHGTGVLIARASPCAATRGGLFRINVVDAPSSAFRPGQLGVTGAARVQKGGGFWAVRHVQRRELHGWLDNASAARCTK